MEKKVRDFNKEMGPLACTTNTHIWSAAFSTVFFLDTDLPAGISSVRDGRRRVPARLQGNPGPDNDEISSLWLVLEPWYKVALFPYAFTYK
jgi:hypothetical protein